jgi:hypothetical protein
MASIGSTVSNLSAVSTTATIGSEPPSSRTAPTANAKSKKQPKRVATLKRGRQAAEPDDDDDATTTTTADNVASTSTNIVQPRAETEEEEAEPARKRRKPTAAAPNIRSTTTGDGYETGQDQPRRSARVARASVGTSAEAVPQPAPRGRAKKGKKGNKRS